jgi:hypothetical protein
MARFVTQSAGVFVTPDDRIEVRRRTSCVACGAVVANKDERAAHRCKSDQEQK